MKHRLLPWTLHHRAITANCGPYLSKQGCVCNLARRIIPCRDLLEELRELLFPSGVVQTPPVPWNGHRPRCRMAEQACAKCLASHTGGRLRPSNLLYVSAQELFGPLSMRALEEDQYVRQTDGYLPDAAVAFIDEIFKANSAILNTLLTILNERLFDNGSQRSRVPLLCLVRSWRIAQASAAW